MHYQLNGNGDVINFSVPIWHQVKQEPAYIV